LLTLKQELLYAAIWHTTTEGGRKKILKIFEPVNKCLKIYFIGLFGCSSLIEDVFIFSAKTLKIFKSTLKTLPLILAPQLGPYLSKVRQSIVRDLSTLCGFLIKILKNCKCSQK
jgi:hypothetical protein